MPRRTNSRRTAPSKQLLIWIWKTTFVLLFLVVFVMTWAVQTQAIRMPQWTKDLSLVPVEEQPKYAAALMSCVSIMFVLSIVAAVMQIRREHVRP